MKVYLKSGQKIKVSQKTANALVEAMISGEKDQILWERHPVSKNYFTVVRVDDIEAIN